MQSVVLCLTSFRKNFATGVEHSTGGSAFSVYHEGTKVVDLWAGFADTDVRQVWKEDTMTVLFSATKGQWSPSLF